MASDDGGRHEHLVDGWDLSVLSVLHDLVGVTHRLVQDGFVGGEEGLEVVELGDFVVDVGEGRLESGLLSTQGRDGRHRGVVG